MKKLNFFKINNNHNIAKLSLLASLITGIFAFNQYFINWYTNADGIIEGLTAFSNTSWVLTGCGRWLLAIMTYFSGNIVMPFVAVIGFSVCTWLSSFLIIKLWNIRSSFFAVTLSILMTVTPTTIQHFVYNAIAFPYGVTILLVTLYVYINFSYSNKYSYFFSIFCMTCVLGIYQCYIGYAAALTLMTLVVKLYRNTDIKKILHDSIKSIITAIAGGIIYYAVLVVILKITGLYMTDRMADTSLSKAVTNIVPSVINAYKFYFSYLNDSVFQRRLIYLLSVIISVVCLLSAFNRNKKENVILSLLFYSLIPLTSNIIVVLLPGSSLDTFMVYHNIMIVALMLALVDNLQITIPDVAKYAVPLLSLLLSWTYIVSANATFASYKLSHQYTYGQMSQVVYDIQHNEEYVLNETPVVIVGYFEDTALRQNIKTYRYAIDLPENLVFWKVPVGVTYNRQKYFMNYFGLDFKDIEYSKYQDVINSAEFKQMNNWPNENSIKTIGKYLVVKIADNYIK